jgi:erythromycin esterase
MIMLRLLTATVVLVVLSVVQAQDKDALTWLRQQAVPVQDDFTLFTKAVGSSRVVMLGELTHGDGTVFAIKSKLIQHLHEHAGFDVLIWESGLMDCADLDAGFAGKKPVDVVAGTGIFGHWAYSAETQPLFEYARRSHATPRQLRMAGFDIQVSGTYGGSRYPTILEWVSQPMVVSAALHQKLSEAMKEAQQAGASPKPAEAIAAVEKKLCMLAPEILKEYAAKEKEIVAKIGASEFAFRRQCLQTVAHEAEMMTIYARFQQKKSGADFIAGYNLREKCNAEHLLWLVNEKYRGKKVIVWAHNSHIFAGLPDVGDTTLNPPGEQQLDSMGRIVKRALKDEAYSIGFMAHTGTWSWLSNPVIKYQTPPTDSLEGLLHQVGKPMLFVDGLAAREAPSMMKPIAGIVNQQQPRLVQAVWPRAYDGVIYLEEMQPRKAVAGRK